MALFFEIAPVTARYQGGIRRGVERALAELGPHEREDYAAQLTAGSAAAHSQTYADWVLRHYVAFSGFLQMMLVVDGREVHRQGVAIRPWEQDFYSPDEQLPAGLRPIVHSERLEGRNIHLYGVVPQELESAARVILDAELLPFVRRYFLNAPWMLDGRIVDLVQTLENQLRALAQSHLEARLPVTFTYFRFQDLTIYFEMSGEHRALEILAEVSEIVRSRLKSGDRLYSLAPGSFLVVSPGARSEQIRERFAGVYFQTRTLVLDYEIAVHTLSELPIRFAELWRHLGV